MAHFFSSSSPPLTLSICPPPNILSKKHPPLRTAVLGAILKDMAQKDVIFHHLVRLGGCIGYILEQYAMCASTEKNWVYPIAKVDFIYNSLHFTTQNTFFHSIWFHVCYLSIPFERGE